MKDIETEIANCTKCGNLQKLTDTILPMGQYPTETMG